MIRTLETAMKKSLALAAAFALAAPAFAAPSLTQIGAAAAVRGAVKAAAPGAQVGRVIGSGKPLFLNDRVTTDAEGRLQILLLDETVFTLGPNADMVLDEFVYDPATNSGKLAAQITKGAFRFVTGKVARRTPENMTVKLAVGTIGIRGTVVVGETGPAGSLVVNAGAAPGNNADEPPSAIFVTHGGKTVYANRTGEGIRVLAGGVPSSPSDMAGELDRISRQLQVKTGRQSARGPLDAPATKRSGQDAAAGRGFAASDIADLGQLSGGNTLQNGFNQQSQSLSNPTVPAIPDGASDWAQIANITGTGVYTGAGTFTCSGGGCSGSSTLSFTLNVDFNSKIVTGGGMTLNPGATGIATLLTDTYSSGITFPTVGQNATLTVGTSGTAITSGAGGIFNGTTYAFTNAGGVAAKQVTMNLTYANFSGQSATGSGTGTRP